MLVYLLLRALLAQGWAGEEKSPLFSVFVCLWLKVGSDENFHDVMSYRIVWNSAVKGKELCVCILKQVLCHRKHRKLGLEGSLGGHLIQCMYIPTELPFSICAHVYIAERIWHLAT